MLIPIFPLPIVQFPSVLTPLHIFEPRYRQMLVDVMSGDRTFGIVYLPENNSQPDSDLIGCTVEILSQELQPDGRSNILCVGKERFRTKEIFTEQPYFQAEVDFFSDEISSALSAEQIAYSQQLFLRIIRASKKSKGNVSEESSPLPELPADPITLSFIIAASLDVPLAEKQLWLAMTNSQRRLRILTNQLTELLETFEMRANLPQRKNTSANNN